ncbi:hypothetical protein ABW20_dc0106070 [Dactylellina cionopaga]|nr:hypothetical protein ABW20_dc0106070 [Dactylellina cionopaga]
MPREDVTVDHYAALEISIAATTDEIKKQFRKLALKYHPDRNPGREAEFNAKFQLIQAAHELLTDPARRKVYDRTRLYHASIHKSKTDQRYDTTTPPSDQAASRKYGPSSTARGGFTPTSRAGDGPFSTKSQWEHTARNYQSGASAWKATQERWQQRSSREVPRTPKKTRENPYATADTDPLSANEPVYNSHRENIPSGKAPLKHNFFADRNPREREWMDPASEARSTGRPNRRSGGFWENKSSSEEDVSRVSSFYAFTPRTRLRTNLHDTSPDKPTVHGNSQTNGSSNPKGNTTSPSEKPISPHHSGIFTRSQTVRETKEHTDQLNSTQAHDRRKSSSSIGIDGTERRKFSYLFNEDGVRRPHRTAKHAAGSDHDGEDDTFPKGRNASLRQSYPSSRRNTLDREGTPAKLPSESRGNNGPKHPERPRFNPHSYTKHEDPQAPLNSFKSFETNKSSPVSFSGGSPNEDQRPKSFSFADWNTVFSGDQNIFAVPVRKGQQSPRKGPAVPKLQTSFNSAGVRLNFSRPRPTSTSAGSSSASKDAMADEPISSAESQESQEPESHTNASDMFPQNAFIFENWKKAFSETNPFDVNPSHQNSSGSTARSASRHRKGATTKKSAGSFTQAKVPNNDGIHNVKGFTPLASTGSNENLPKSTPMAATPPIIPTNINPTTSAPSPIAMDIDTPRESPTPTSTIPVTPINRKPSSLRQSKTYHSPTVSDEDPVSPIKGDNLPISPLRPDEVPQKDNDGGGKPSIYPAFSNTQSRNAESEPEPVRGEAFLDMENFRNTEPISYHPSNGLNGHWQDLQDSLPFESKPASYVNISSSPPLPQRPMSIPRPPEAPITPANPSSASYDKYCATMTVYQAHWNEYNAKIVNHMRARLDADVLQCAQNKGFATGTSSDPKAGVHLDLIQTRKTLAELDEDQQIRTHWEGAVKNHINVLTEWKKYLEHLEINNEFS